MSPDVVNPAVYEDGQQHIEVNPQGEPLLRFLVAKPVNYRRLVHLSLQTVAQVSWNCEHKHTKVKGSDQVFRCLIMCVSLLT